jgi:hypothetical protein
MHQNAYWFLNPPYANKINALGDLFDSGGMYLEVTKAGGKYQHRSEQKYDHIELTQNIRELCWP